MRCCHIFSFLVQFFLTLSMFYEKTEVKVEKRSTKDGRVKVS